MEAPTTAPSPSPRAKPQNGDWNKASPRLIPRAAPTRLQIHKALFTVSPVGWADLDSWCDPTASLSPTRAETGSPARKLGSSNPCAPQAGVLTFWTWRQAGRASRGRGEEVPGPFSCSCRRRRRPGTPFIPKDVPCRNSSARRHAPIPPAPARDAVPGCARMRCNRHQEGPSSFCAPRPSGCGPSQQLLSPIPLRTSSSNGTETADTTSAGRQAGLFAGVHRSRQRRCRGRPDSPTEQLRPRPEPGPRFPLVPHQGRDLSQGWRKSTSRPVPAAASSRTDVFVTSYTWFDNTPSGAAVISHTVLHKAAGGTGTYADPVTIAVGHSWKTGQDVLDIPSGTRIYLPDVRRYFIVEDTCGDGPKPEEGPCPTGAEKYGDAALWIDMWIGGKASPSPLCATVRGRPRGSVRPSLSQRTTNRWLPATASSTTAPATRATDRKPLPSDLRCRTREYSQERRLSSNP